MLDSASSSYWIDDFSACVTIAGKISKLLADSIAIFNTQLMHDMNHDCGTPQPPQCEVNIVTQLRLPFGNIDAYRT